MVYTLGFTRYSSYQRRFSNFFRDKCIAAIRTKKLSFPTVFTLTITADISGGLETWAIALIAVIPTLFILGEYIHHKGL